MHTCPECGQACTCNGDIDDCLDICENDSDNCIHDCGDFADFDEARGFGCCYPCECCMPGPKSPPAPAHGEFSKPANA